MRDLAIRAECLGKQYRLGQDHGAMFTYGSLRESLSRAFRGSWRRNANGNDGRVWALRDVSFEIRHGDVVGIIGRNGAGKSTLLKLLSGITTPTTGRAEIHGRVGSLLEVGTGFHPELSGRENVYLNGAILGMRRAEIDRKFDEIVAFAEVEPFLDTPVKRYSSGMYMRLAFAVAAFLDPEILLIDEVLAVGDAPFQKKCLGKMGEVARGGRTVLFVSHNMNAIQDLCGSAILLEHGQIRQRGEDVRAITREYLFGGETDLPTASWSNDGTRFENPYFKPLRFRIVGDDGATLPMPIRNDARAFIEIEGEVRKLEPALNVGYALYSEQGELLYWCYHTDPEEQKWPVIEPGRPLLRTPVPARLLNEGSYRVELIGGLHFRRWLFQPGVSAPAIFLTIQGGLSESPYWMHRRPGVLAPVFEWTRVR